MAEEKETPLAAGPNGGVEGPGQAASLPQSSPAELKQAAETIQRNYRGYRERRQLNGLGLDPSTRWEEAIKEARYRNLIRPRPHRERSDATTASVDSSKASTTSSTFAQSEWSRLKQIARRAHNDDTSDSDGPEGLTVEQRQEYRRHKQETKRKREQNAKDMGLEYWLEMVDVKHRYGSHLRSYHAIWKSADTHDNFFYWLDEGDGRNIDSPRCSREVLDRDQVRYLSREERRQYLVKFDKQGRLRWAKNDELINTNPNFKDSLQGIVPLDDTTPAFREDLRYPGRRLPAEGSGSSSDSGEDSETDGAHYVNEDLSEAKGLSKVEHVSANAVLNHLLKSTTKKNTWIFVADTSFRMYCGIKQPGAFQHSSFLHGARIASAGQIVVKNGQIRSLAPLSGHYRPPTSAFRAFVHSLKEKGVDMSRVNISKSYAVLLGVEGYMKTKKRAKDRIGDLTTKFERVIRPEDARRKAEQSEDKSESAKLERAWLERQKTERREQGFRSSLGRSLGRVKSSSSDVTRAEPGQKAH